MHTLLETAEDDAAMSSTGILIFQMTVNPRSPSMQANHMSLATNLRFFFPSKSAEVRKRRKVKSENGMASPHQQDWHFRHDAAFICTGVSSV